MTSERIQDALDQVETVRRIVLAKRLFRGYSGVARVVGGAGALACAFVLSSRAFPRSLAAHLAGWAAVLALALAANYGALLVWFHAAWRIRRDMLELAPTVDAIPPLALGAALTLALVRRGQYDLLFGVWMGMYGLAHAAYRLSLPRGHLLVGAFYLLCGACCLICPQVSFVDPWPMGIVFFFGELAGGSILWRLRKETEAEESVSKESPDERED